MNAARQVVHILAKDIRGHAPEIGLVVLLNVVLAVAFTETWEVALTRNRGDTLVSDAAQVLLIVAWGVLIGRVVQSDGVAGKAPYSLTRPGSRTTLLVAKLAFVLLFVHLPGLLSQLAIVVGSGVPLSFPQLLVNQALFAAGMSLPLTAVAALTTNFSRFVLCGVVVAAVLVFVSGPLDGPPAYVMATALAILALIAVAALASQYRWRSTLRVAAWSVSALVLLGSGSVTLAYYSFMQRTRASVIEPPIFPSIAPPIIPSTIRLLDASERDSRDASTIVSLPIDTGFADDAFVSYYKIEVHTAAGSKVSLHGWGLRLRRTGESHDWLDLQLSPTDFETYKDSLVSVRLVTDLETYESRQMEPIPLDGSIAIVGGRAQCGTISSNSILCRTSFGQSLWRLDASNTEARLRWLPLRLRFAFNPIEIRQFGTRFSERFPDASIATVLREPVSYTRQEVTFENIRLSDWAAERSEATE
jgi:hypothetical protein